MRRNAVPTRIWSLTAFLFLNACSGSFSPLSKSDEFEEDDEDDTADKPVEVSGSFLTVHCDSDGFSIEQDKTIGDDRVVSCLIKNDDGTRFDKPLSSVTSEVFLENGGLIPAETQISASPPWHFYIKMSDADRKKVSTGDFKIVSSEQISTVHSEEFDYKWFEDPLFAFLVIGLKASPEPERVVKGMESVFNITGEEQHLTFASDQIFSGNFGIENADSYCDLEGKKLKPDRTWKALISTKEQSAFERIPITKPVFNVFGDGIAYISADKSAQQNFWTPEHYGSIRQTQTGKHTNLYDEFQGDLRVFDLIWTGTTIDGSLDSEYGNCNDWTSANEGVTGTVGATPRLSEGEWIRSKRANCSDLARIVCISL